MFTDLVNKGIWLNWLANKVIMIVRWMMFSNKWTNWQRNWKIDNHQCLMSLWKQIVLSFLKILIKGWRCLIN